MPSKSDEKPPIPEHDTGKDKDAALQAKLDNMSFFDAVDSKVIWHNEIAPKKRVHEHTTSTGRVLAIKPSELAILSEAEMMQFAASHGVPAPKVHGFYEVIATRPLVKVIVSDRVPGVPLADVWHTFKKAQTAALATQLRGILAQMRTHTQPFIGRPNRTQTINMFHLQSWKLMGPFDDEDVFDEWFYARLPRDAFTRWRFRSFFASEKKRRAKERKKRGDPAPRFVLTHGDLSPRNIMVQGTTITGIVDWRSSGFFPEWAEFVFASMEYIGSVSKMEKWWLGVIKRLGLPVDKRRQKLARKLMNQYVWSGWID